MSNDRMSTYSWLRSITSNQLGQKIRPRHKKVNRNNASHTECRCQAVEGKMIGPEEETTLDLNFEGSQYLNKR